jgi:hypothetical protein
MPGLPQPAYCAAVFLCETGSPEKKPTPAHGKWTQWPGPSSPPHTANLPLRISAFSAVQWAKTSCPGRQVEAGTDSQGGRWSLEDPEQVNTISGPADPGPRR